jgi:hypothetical protein
MRAKTPSAAAGRSGSTSMTVAALSPRIPSTHAEVPRDLAEGRVLAHGETEEDCPDGHHQQPDQQQGVEHGLVRLPEKHQRRLLHGGLRRQRGTDRRAGR